MPELSQAYAAAPNCIVAIDGTPIDDLVDALVRAEVNIHRSRPAMARITFNTTRSEDDGNWQVADSELLRPWKTLAVTAVLDGEEILLFSGYIVQIEIEFSGDAPHAVVIGQDKTILLDREHKTRVWGGADQPVTDADVVNAIVAEHGLSAQAQTGGSHCGLNQDETDVRLMNRLARANGFELGLYEDKFYFGPPRLDAENDNPILIYYGEQTNCSAFNLLDDGYKPDAVQVDVYHDRDYERQVLTPEQERLGTEPCDQTSVALGPFVWKVPVHGLPAAQGLAEARAKVEENAWKITATGTLDGLAYGAVLTPGKTVMVQGICETHTGRYYVDEVTHQISARGYEQNFVLLRNARN
jgi:phage protein D